MNEATSPERAEPERRPARAALLRAAAVLEVAAAIGLCSLLLWPANLRALLAKCAQAIFEGALAAASLSIDDPPTLLLVAAALAKLALLTVPLGRMLALSPRHRLAWIPALALLFLFVYGMAVPGIAGAWTWIVASGVAALAWFAVRVPALRMMAFLPWLIAAEPTLGHSPLSDRVWPPARLAPRCEANDGVRPSNVSDAQRGTRYFGVTVYSPELLLLHGERHSMWVRRDGSETTLAPELPMTGNFWEGCVRDGAVWLSHNGRFCRVTPPEGEGDAGRAECWRPPMPPGAGVELDFVDPVCPPDRESVYVSQLVRGGLLEFSPDTERVDFHPVISGLNLQVVPHEDRLIGITTSTLLEFEAPSGRVAWQRPAGLVALGVDVCERDGAIAVTDFAGRLRLFERDGDGPPVLRGGHFLPASRRVAFSPDCAHIAVTSGDDHELFLVRREGLEVERTWSVGPGLRDITFADDRWLAVADACTLTLLDTASP